MSPDETESRILDPCPNCTTLIDVTATEPFSEIHCPICGTRMRVRKQFNNFALQQVIGEGGMGTVFEALDLNLLRSVAVKILKREYSADEESIAKLETEARITASISHPHVVKVFSAGRDHGQFYLAMELVGRGTLDQLMSLQGRVAEIQVLDVGIQVADGLKAAAQLGLIHRDVKPGNILFSDAHTAKVVDFGLAVLMEDEAKTRGEVWGTPYYVAPEKLNNEPEDFRSDIYSLGGTLFHALAGRPPFEAESASLVALKHLKSQVVSLQAFAPDVSNETAFVINRMLHKDPLQRYQSYDELIEHLQYAKAQLLSRNAQGIRAKPRVVVESDQSRSFTAWITVSLLVLVLALGSIVFFKREAFFGKKEVPDSTATPARTSNQSSSTFEEAYNLLTRGEAEEAILLFDQVINNPSTQQPRLNWAKVQKGLALEISGHRAEAAELFGQLDADGLYTEEFSQIALANFFVEVGRLMKDNKPIPGTTTVVYGNADYQAMALLTFAIKDWSLGKYGDAAQLLKSFVEGKLEDSYSWVGEYKMLAQKYLDDYAVYAGTLPIVEAGINAETQTKALEAVRKAKGRLATSGTMPTRFDEWEKALSAGLKNFLKKEEQQTIDAARAAAEKDIAAWVLLKKDIPLALQNFSPETVLSRLNRANYTHPETAQQKDREKARLQLLADFKKQIIDAVNTGGYKFPITKRDGASIPGIATQATQLGLEITSTYGRAPLAWKDVNPSAIVSIAEKLLPDQPPGQRQWLIGVYTTLCWNQETGKQILLDTAQNNEQLRDQLSIFF